MLKKISHGFLVGIFVTIVFVGLFSVGLFKTWQDTASDRIFPTRTVSSNIVILAIDNKSISEIGRWPWDRKVFADVLAEIQKGQPLSVGIDVAFLESQNDDSDSALSLAISKLGNVTLAAEADGENVILPIPTLQSQATSGLANISTDVDGVARHAPLTSTDTDGKTYNLFAIEVLNNYLKKKGQAEVSPSQIPTEDGQLRINFAGGPNSFTRVSFVDVLEGKIPPAEFRDKIVLIGATAPDLHDNQITPVSNGVPMDGVEIHANIIHSILENKYIYPESSESTILTTAILSIFLAVLLMFLPILPAIFVMMVCVALYFFWAIFSFDQGVIKHMILPPLAIIVTGVVDIVYKYFGESRQKRFIKKALSFYLSHDVLSEILNDPSKLKLGGERKEITVLFSDIAGFTTISEKLEPEVLAHMLNGYLNKMTEIVFENRGVLDKYIGDAVMAFWGAPIKTKNHALFACKTALSMHEAMADIRIEWTKEDVHDFDMRIGINTGEMVVGNMGSDARFDYTLIGDNVNLGARLEGINKEYGTKIIISQQTYNEASDHVIARKLDTVAVKGKKTGVVIYELRGIGRADKEEQAFLNDFENARLLYEKGEFKKSQKLFKEFEVKYPEDNPAKVYIERLHELVKNPPSDWDGIFKAKSK